MNTRTMVTVMLIPALLTLTGSPATAGSRTANWQELCRQAAAVRFPAEDRPAPELLKGLQDCSSYDLYYGFNGQPDPERARLCAYAELNRPGENGPFQGEAMLITIYANGVGAKRNLDLALKLACKEGWAPAEIEGRVQHLAELKD